MSTLRRRRFGNRPMNRAVENLLVDKRTSLREVGDLCEVVMFSVLLYRLARRNDSVTIQPCPYDERVATTESAP